jgi:hypothetical protein
LKATTGYYSSEPEPALEDTPLKITYTLMRLGPVLEMADICPLGIYRRFDHLSEKGRDLVAT